MGKRSAAGELFLGNMGSIQRETRPSMQREDQLTMETKLERIAAKCCESPVEERSAGNPHATFCGSRRWATASGHPVVMSNRDPYSDCVCSHPVRDILPEGRGTCELPRAPGVRARAQMKSFWKGTRSERGGRSPKPRKGREFSLPCRRARA